jgi:general secretion pathway protein G
MAIIATLLTVALPLLQRGGSKEVTLRQSLGVMRDAIDKFYADTGRYPEKLEDLVEKRYIRAVPLDPITESTETWVLVPVPGALAQGAVYDVKSGAKGNAGEETC